MTKGQIVCVLIIVGIVVAYVLDWLVRKIGGWIFGGKG